MLDEANWHLSSDGGLVNIAPTVLQLMGITPAADMTNSLLLRKLPGKRCEERHHPKKLRVA